MSKYAEVLRPFVALMEKELHANSHKGDREGWLQMTEEQALGEIEYHVSKLSKAMTDMNPDGIREYAADVANLCMMLLDIGGSLHLFQTGAYEVELGQERWAKVHAVFDRYNQSEAMGCECPVEPDEFRCEGSDLNGLVSEILVELDLARAE